MVLSWLKKNGAKYGKAALIAAAIYNGSRALQHTGDAVNYLRGNGSKRKRKVVRKKVVKRKRVVRRRRYY